LAFSSNDPDDASRIAEEASGAPGAPQQAIAHWNRVAAAARGHDRAEALIRAAELADGPLGDAAQAFALRRRAWLHDPDHPDLLTALGRHAEQTSDWILLARVEARRFAAEGSATERARIALDLARLERETLHNRCAARDWIQRGLEVAPEDLRLHEALAELARESGQSVVWLEQLEQMIRLQGDAAPVSLLLRAAELHAGQGSVQRAVTHVQRAVQRAPEDTDPLDALIELFSRLRRYGDLADVIERRIALTTEDPKGRAAWLARLGALHETNLFDAESALDAYRRARDLDPERADVEAALIRLESKRPDGEDGAIPGPDAALAAYEREAETTHDRERLGVLVREIVRLHARLDTSEQSVRWVQRWIALCPEEPDALRALAHLHDRPGQEPRLAIALEALDRLLEPAEQIANRQRMAALYTSLGRHEDAERAWSLALELDARHPAALEGRAHALRALDRVDDLIGALEHLGERQDPEQRRRTRRELAEILEGNGDPAGAIAVLAELEAEGGEAREISEALDELLTRMGRNEEVEARLARRIAESDVGCAEAVALELRRATLLLDALERPTDAAAAYRRVLEHAPESREARMGLERALRSSVDAPGLAAFLEDQESRTTDPASRDRLALERAVLLEELLDRPEEALSVFARLAHESAVPEVLRDAERRAEQLLERLQRWSELRDHLSRRLGRHSVSEDARLHERLARLCAERLGDNDEEMQHLERVVALDPDRAEIWQALAHRYEREGRLDDWARALEAELAIGPDHVRELTLRARLAELYRDRLNRPDRAREHYQRVFELSPAHSGAAQFLVDVYEEEGRFDEVIALLEARLASIDVSDSGDLHATQRRTALRLQIAGIRDAKLDDLEGAISALEVALSEVGPVPMVAERLAAAYQRAGYGPDLIDLCRQAAGASSEPAERANWWVRLGDAHLSRDEPREAADVYRRALAERPGDRAVAASLRELYRAMGHAEPLAELLDGELRHLAGASEIPVRLELVELLRERRPAAALLHARRVLQLEPRHANAYESAKRLALGLGKPEEALAIVETRLRACRSPEDPHPYELERARLLAGPLERPAEAARAYRAVLEAHPGRAGREVLAELSALLERTERWAEWLDCAALQLREMPPETRADYIDRVARAASERVSPDAALPWLERLRRERPGDVDVLSRISLVHRERGQEEALVCALEAEAAALPPGDRRRRLYMERASLLRASGAPGRALAALTEVGPDVEALLMRESIERELGLSTQRAVTLEALLALRGPDLAMHRELALLYAVDLTSPREARRHWEAAQRLAPSNSEAQIELMRALAETERSAGRIDRWARCAEAELAALDPAPVFDDRRRELRRELATVYDEQLARPDAALAHLRALLDAGDGELLGRAVLDRVESACLRRLRAGDEAVELERRLARRLERIGGSTAEWVELAELREETLCSAQAALEAYRKALDEQPDHLDALRGWRRNAERLGRWSDVAEALEREIECTGDRDAVTRGALLRTLGDLYWHRLSSTTGASRCYAAALEANASDFAALRALERLLEAMEDWRGALDLYESEVEVLSAANPRRRREIWLHVAALAADRGEDPARAREALLRAAEIEPLAPVQLAELSSLQERLGDTEAFIETFAAWCDTAENASGADHLRLALALEEAGRPDAALARVERAAASDPGDPRIWDAAARLRAANGDHLGSARALRRAAERLPDRAAAQRLRAAAQPLRSVDPPAALDLLRSATERCPQDAAIQTERALLAAELGNDEEAEHAARAALDGQAEELEDARRAAAARAGADAARRRGRCEAAAGLYREALRLEPGDPGSLGAYGETLFALGDHPAARAVLEQRLAAPGENPQRALHRALLGRCREIGGALEDALVQYQSALENDPSQPLALEASVRVLEQLDRLEPGIAAIERWARSAREPEVSAARLLRAAEWELRRGGHRDSAERHLRAAVAADADLARVWIALAELRLEDGRLEETIEAVDRAAGRVRDPADLGKLAHLQGRAYEQKGARREAAEAFGIAAECDPRCAEAALSQARLLRGFGEWRAAAAALAGFAERRRDEDSSLADVYEQLGRLRAGPLEDLDGAVLSYRRAIELAPDRLEARAALAELLSHRPGDWREAMEHHRIVLAARPTHPGCLRVALRIARGRGDAAGIALGVAIQRALGIASAYETEEEALEATPLVASESLLGDARFEILRRVAVEAAGEIASALQASIPGPASAPSDDPVLTFRGRMLAVQGELSAPALLPLSTRELEEVLRLVVQLVVEPAHVTGDGNLVNALAEALGRRRRRRLRRILTDLEAPEDLCEIDFCAWQTEMRALAAAETLRRTGAPLRTALLALIAGVDDASELAGESYLAPRVEADPAARAFLRRVVDHWLAGP